MTTTLRKSGKAIKTKRAGVVSSVRPGNHPSSELSARLAGRLSVLRKTIPRLGNRRTGRARLGFCVELADHQRRAEQLCSAAPTQIDRNAVQSLVDELAEQRASASGGGRLAKAVWLERSYGFTLADAEWILEAGILEATESVAKSQALEEDLGTTVLAFVELVERVLHALLVEATNEMFGRSSELATIDAIPTAGSPITRSEHYPRASLAGRLGKISANCKSMGFSLRELWTKVAQQRSCAPVGRTVPNSTRAVSKQAQ